MIQAHSKDMLSLKRLGNQNGDGSVLYLDDTLLFHLRQCPYQ